MWSKHLLSREAAPFLVLWVQKAGLGISFVSSFVFCLSLSVASSGSPLLQRSVAGTRGKKKSPRNSPPSRSPRPKALTDLSSSLHLHSRLLLVYRQCWELEAVLSGRNREKHIYSAFLEAGASVLYFHSVHCILNFF